MAVWTARAIPAPLTTDASGVEAEQPAVLVFAAAVLDVGQLLAQRQREFADGLLVEEVLALEHADRGHDGGGAAREDLDDVAGCDIRPPLVERDRAALDRVTAILGELQDGVARDALEDRRGVRGHDS